MRVVGVICEYDPFHNGHALHLARARAQAQADYVVCAMSGSFTQRGTPAMLDKWTRARMALMGGADLVVELPFAFCCAQAERFARGGVSLLGALGVVTHLAFGCEPAGLPYLLPAADALERPTPRFREALARALGEGCSYPRAQAEALAPELGGAQALQALSLPNFTLALEYVRALRALAPQVQPLPVAREGAGYHDEALSPLASATAIRLAARQGAWEEVAQAMPDVGTLQSAMSEGRCAQEDAFARLLLYRLRMADAAQLRALYDMPEGLEHRILRAAQDAGTYEELIARVKSKRYTRARIARSFAHALVGFTREVADALPVPSYARVLGLRLEAAPLLRAVRERASVPLVHRAAPFEREGGASLALDVRATDLRGLCCPAGDARRGRLDMRTPPIVLRA